MVLLGKMPTVAKGTTVVARGMWDNNPKHGWQIKCVGWRGGIAVMPAAHPLTAWWLLIQGQLAAMVADCASPAPCPKNPAWLAPGW